MTTTEQPEVVGHLEDAPTVAVGEVAGRSTVQLAWARLRRDKVALASGVVIVLLILLAIFAPLVADLTGHGRDQQFHQTAQDLSGLPVGPNGTFWLGADDLGRDVLVRTIYGARVSLIVGVGATLVAAIIGTIVGMAAGFVGGRLDAFLSRVIDVFLSFPFLLTSLTLLTLNRNQATGAVKHSPVLIVTLILAFFSWTYFARLTRGQVLSLREREFIEAARSLGAGSFRIMFLDILPNLVGPVIVYITLQIPVNIVLEATLSFLGVGVSPPEPTWGNMLAEAQNGGLYQSAPWFLLTPTVALLLTVLAFNLLGDGLRDALDPRASRTMAKG